MWDVILDSLIDSAKATPFLLVIYIVIEFLEGNAKAKHRAVKLLNGKCAPLIAGGMGIIPQCGFSVMATDLYCQNFIKTGTLVAFFVATSDEALPILWSNKDTFVVAWMVVAIKVVYAIILGFVINAFERKELSDNFVEEEHQGCCHHEITHKPTFWQFIKHPLLHTLKIFAYIFVVNAIFGLLLFYFESQITSIVESVKFLQPLVVSLVGLVPNCASSVIITSMYTEGIITLPSLIGGLVSNSGIALAILFKDKVHTKRNFLILGAMYLAGVLIGLLLSIFL